MNPISFDEWSQQEACLLWATENGGNASQVINYLDQGQISYQAVKALENARWTFTISTTNSKAPEIISRLKQF